MILGSWWGPKSMQNEVRNKLGTWLGKKRGSRPPRDASRRLLRLQDAARSRLRPNTAPTWPPKTNATEGFWTSKIGLGPKRPPKTDFSNLWTAKRPQNHQILNPETIRKSLKIDQQSIPNSVNIETRDIHEALSDRQLSQTGARSQVLNRCKKRDSTD